MTRIARGDARWNSFLHSTPRPKFHIIINCISSSVKRLSLAGLSRGRGCHLFAVRLTHLGQQDDGGVPFPESLGQVFKDPPLVKFKLIWSGE